MWEVHGKLKAKSAKIQLPRLPILQWLCFSNCRHIPHDNAARHCLWHCACVGFGGGVCQSGEVANGHCLTHLCGSECCGGGAVSFAAAASLDSRRLCLLRTLIVYWIWLWCSVRLFFSPPCCKEICAMLPHGAWQAVTKSLRQSASALWWDGCSM